MAETSKILCPEKKVLIPDLMAGCSLASGIEGRDVRLTIAVPQATSMDKFLTESVSKAQIQRFPGNAEAIAAFQAGRVEAVCLFHPPLLAARQKLGIGKIVVPTPVKSNPTSVGVRKDDAAFRDFVDAKLGEYYKSRKVQEWYETFLKDYGLDPKAVPPIIKEMLG